MFNNKNEACCHSWQVPLSPVAVIGLDLNEVELTASDSLDSTTEDSAYVGIAYPSMGNRHLLHTSAPISESSIPDRNPFSWKESFVRSFRADRFLLEQTYHFLFGLDLSEVDNQEAIPFVSCLSDGHKCTFRSDIHDY